VIARIEPAAGTSGAAVKALLGHFRPDKEWAADLGQVREFGKPLHQAIRGGE
jgi:hypothetical protein